MILRTYAEREQCYGCHACANVCNKDCISLVEDAEGFRYPLVDSAKCNECGLCVKVCPIGKQSTDLRSELNTAPRVVVGYALDKEERKRSASGGFSYLLSKAAIEQEGVVFGVVGAVPGEIYHTAAHTEAELRQMCGSKYVQSDVKNTFRQAKTALKTGQQVVFTGTPCQIAGLYGYLGKEYSNLITIDLICHGVPSHKVLRKYLKEREEAEGKRIVYFGRDKSAGYCPAKYSITYQDNSTEIEELENSYYRQGYLLNLFQRHSCYNCKFASIPRIGDFSVGDIFVDYELTLRIDAENAGGTMMTINTSAGEAYFDKIKKDIFFESYPLERAVLKSYHLNHAPCFHARRKDFFELLIRKRFNDAAKICLGKTFMAKVERRLKSIMKRYLIGR